MKSLGGWVGGGGGGGAAGWGGWGDDFLMLHLKSPLELCLYFNND